MLRSYAITLLMLAAATGQARAADILFQQASGSSGSLILSSRTSDPNGSDYDTSVFDNFTLLSTREITGLTWRGGYDVAQTPANTLLGFSINIYSSAAVGTEPDKNSNVATFFVSGTANETSAGTIGGTPMFNYSFTFDTAFTATANTKYWLQIQAVQLGVPDWGFARATGGDNGYWRELGTGASITYGIAAGDAAFTLSGPPLSAVPEPETYALFGGIGVLGFTFWHRTRRRGNRPQIP